MSLFFNSGCCRPAKTCTCVESCKPACTCNDNCKTECTTVCTEVCPETTPVTCNCTCNCTCTCNGDNGGSTAGATTPAPQTVRAMINTVIDSCCTTDDVCREITLCCPDIFNPDELEVGTVLDIELAGDVTYKEVNRDKDDCVCVSTVRFNIPVRIYGNEGCGCCSRSIVRNITVIRSARLCCTGSSLLTTNNSRPLAISAVVSDICGNQVTITLSILFRACLQQTMLREYTWQATPVCEYENCWDARNSLIDNCDTVCGCGANSKKSCPSC